MTRGERVIAVSNCVRDYITTNYPHPPPARIRVIPRGIEPERYFPAFQPTTLWRNQWANEFPHLSGKRLLTLPGRITRLKGHEDFLRLLTQLRLTYPDIHGVIVGGAHVKRADYFTEIQQHARQLGLADQVTFTGHRSDLREILTVSDLVLSLSTQPEAFGRTTLEALALGRPVLGYAHGGVGELLQKFFPSGAVSPGDHAALLKTASKLLTTPTAPAAVGSPYTLTAMCRGTVAVYRELVAGITRKTKSAAVRCEMGWQAWRVHVPCVGP
jgi:glycosyltransferase involved in cell wall biosynthesis